MSDAELQVTTLALYAAIAAPVLGLLITIAAQFFQTRREDRHRWSEFRRSSYVNVIAAAKRFRDAGASALGDERASQDMELRPRNRRGREAFAALQAATDDAVLLASDAMLPRLHLLIAAADALADSYYEQIFALENIPQDVYITDAPMPPAVEASLLEANGRIERSVSNYLAAETAFYERARQELQLGSSLAARRLPRVSIRPRGSSNDHGG